MWIMVNRICTLQCELKDIRVLINKRRIDYTHGLNVVDAGDVDNCAAGGHEVGSRVVAHHQGALHKLVHQRAEVGETISPTWASHRSFKQSRRCLQSIHAIRHCVASPFCIQDFIANACRCLSIRDRASRAKARALLRVMTRMNCCYVSNRCGVKRKWYTLIHEIPKTHFCAIYLWVIKATACTSMWRMFCREKHKLNIENSIFSFQELFNNWNLHTSVQYAICKPYIPEYPVCYNAQGFAPLHTYNQIL